MDCLNKITSIKLRLWLKLEHGVKPMIDNSPSMIRQKYIEEAASMFKQHFKDNWWTVPNNVRLSIGVPVGNRDGKKKLGICHGLEASQDGHYEIFINPEFTNADSTVEILETIAHELVHATVNVSGHRGKFKACALAFGFLPPILKELENINGMYGNLSIQMIKCYDILILV